MPIAMSQTPKQPADRPVPTSADVARLAGVSRATVSYVLNNTSAVRISEPTRARVRAAAEELGYVPHAAARSLRAGHTRIVLLPTAHIPVGPLYSRFFNELQWELRRLDYTVVQYGSLGLGADEAARAWAELRPVAVVSLGEIELTPQGVQLLKRSGARAVDNARPAARRGRARARHGPARDRPERGRPSASNGAGAASAYSSPTEDGLDFFSRPRLAGAREAVHGTDAVVEPVAMAYEEEAGGPTGRAVAGVGAGRGVRVQRRVRDAADAGPPGR